MNLKPFLKLLFLVTVILAIVNPAIPIGKKKLNVVILVDCSYSLVRQQKGNESSLMLENIFIEQARKFADRHSIRLSRFGANADADSVPLSPDRPYILNAQDIDGFDSVPSVALEGSPDVVLLLCDGNLSPSGSMSMIRICNDRKIPVYSLPSGLDDLQDAFVSEVQIENKRATGMVRSNFDGDCTVNGTRVAVKRDFFVTFSNEAVGQEFVLSGDDLTDNNSFFVMPAAIAAPSVAVLSGNAPRWKFLNPASDLSSAGCVVIDGEFAQPEDEMKKVIASGAGVVFAGGPAFPKLPDCPAILDESGAADTYFLFDSSGSMDVPISGGRRKFDVAKDLLRKIISNQNGRFGLITFSDNPQFKIEAPLEWKEFDSALDPVLGFTPAGATNTIVALKRCFELLQSAGGNKRVILISDGETKEPEEEFKQLAHLAAAAGFCSVILDESARSKYHLLGPVFGWDEIESVRKTTVYTLNDVSVKADSRSPLFDDVPAEFIAAQVYRARAKAGSTVAAAAGGSVFAVVSDSVPRLCFIASFPDSEIIKKVYSNAVGLCMKRSAAASARYSAGTVYVDVVGVPLEIAEVKCLLKSAKKNLELTLLRTDTNEFSAKAGLQSGVWQIECPKFSVRVFVPPTGEAIQCGNNLAVLREISERTGGKLVSTADEALNSVSVDEKFPLRTILIFAAMVIFVIEYLLWK